VLDATSDLYYPLFAGSTEGVWVPNPRQCSSSLHPTPPLTH